MTDKIINNYVQEFLPKILERIVESLDEFTQYGRDENDETDITKNKNFIDYHKAIKISLSNIELLLKFLKTQDMAVDSFSETGKIRRLLKQAQAEVIQHLEDNSI